MSALRSPRGPLPARVYWFRRAVVLGLAFVLVFGVARVFGAGSDGSDGGDGADTAAPAAADPQTSAPEDTSTGEPQRRRDRPARASGPTQGPTVEPPAEPEGDCAPEDVLVEPSVFRPVEDGKVLIGLDVSTGEVPACTWQVSAESLTMKITSGDDDIWNTRQCPGAVPDRELVARAADIEKVVIEWSGRRSDDECSAAPDYALPGYYVVEAAAIAGEPSTTQFQLKAPPPPTITRAPSPSASPSDDERGNGNGNGNRGNGDRPSREPSGAVEPDGR